MNHDDDDDDALLTEEVEVSHADVNNGNASSKDTQHLVFSAIRSTSALLSSSLPLSSSKTLSPPPPPPLPHDMASTANIIDRVGSSHSEGSDSTIAADLKKDLIPPSALQQRMPRNSPTRKSRFPRVEEDKALTITNVASCDGGFAFGSGLLDDDDESCASSSSSYQVPYFTNDDFQVSTWYDVLSSYQTSVGMGAAALLTATAVVVHPLATAVAASAVVWAVGVVGYDFSESYEYFSDMSFRKLFWDDAPLALSQVNCSDYDYTSGFSSAILGVTGSEDVEEKKTGEGAVVDSIPEQHVEADVALVEERVALAKQKAELLDMESCSTDVSAESASNPTSASQDTPEPEETATPIEATTDSQIAPSADVPAKSTVNKKQLQEQIKKCFPELPNEVVKDVEFPGLSASDFFRVFFSDDAPYNFSEFQKNRGDVDISYGKWASVGENKVNDPKDLENASLHLKANGGKELARELTKERTLKFKTLTKSYFGPAYATAVKTQRMTKESKRLVILESRSRLQDIPFCDRFQVVDRWTITSERDEANKSRHIAKLSIHFEVQFMDSCTFESQIRKKSSQTMEEIATTWCQMATKALERTEQHKLWREREEEDDCISLVTANSSTFHSTMPATTTSTIPTSIPIQVPNKKREELIALHEKKFGELEEKLAAVNVDDVAATGDGSSRSISHSGSNSGIEVEHTKASTGQVHSRVLGEVTNPTTVVAPKSTALQRRRTADFRLAFLKSLPAPTPSTPSASSRVSASSVDDSKSIKKFLVARTESTLRRGLGKSVFQVFSKRKGADE
mmetsp:Transcript_24613/g.34734  ORF Transcript_24613/g.34734 Transcript_24613/m.34734 type:complete len:798 (+) Transcript_24613:996-3389(+)